jgi:hypothetical protein
LLVAVSGAKLAQDRWPFAVPTLSVVDVRVLKPSLRSRYYICVMRT